MMKFIVSSFYKDQAIHMKPSFHEYHETKVFEFEVLRSLNNHPIYDEYQDDEEQIYTSTHMEFYSTKPVYDNYKGIEKVLRSIFLHSQMNKYTTLDQFMMCMFFLMMSHK
jgi:hypothetical protein